MSINSPLGSIHFWSVSISLYEKNLECLVPFRHFGQSLSRSAHESPLITITHHGWRRRHLSRFGSEQIITFIAMATPDDLNANAEFIRLADSFVEVPGAAPSFFLGMLLWFRGAGVKAKAAIFKRKMGKGDMIWYDMRDMSFLDIWLVVSSIFYFPI